MAFEIRSVYQLVSCIESSAANKAQATFSENDLPAVQESLRRLNFQFDKLIKSPPNLSPQSLKRFLNYIIIFTLIAFRILRIILRQCLTNVNSVNSNYKQFEGIIISLKILRLP